jgi:hypothetical protein
MNVNRNTNDNYCVNEYDYNKIVRRMKEINFFSKIIKNIKEVDYDFPQSKKSSSESVCNETVYLNLNIYSVCGLLI